MKTTALIAAMSILSDAQALLYLDPQQASKEINHAKKIMMHYSRNLDQTVDTADITNLLAEMDANMDN